MAGARSRWAVSSSVSYSSREISTASPWRDMISTGARSLFTWARRGKRFLRASDAVIAMVTSLVRNTVPLPAGQSARPLEPSTSRRSARSADLARGNLSIRVHLATGPATLTRRLRRRRTTIDGNGPVDRGLQLFEEAGTRDEPCRESVAAVTMRRRAGVRCGCIANASTEADPDE